MVKKERIGRIFWLLTCSSKISTMEVFVKNAVLFPLSEVEGMPEEGVV